MNDETTNVKFTPQGKMVRRYEVVDDGETPHDEEYAYYQNTAHKPLRSKYDPVRKSLAEKQLEEKGRPLTFIANDDLFCKPITLFFNPRKHRNMTALCEEIYRLQCQKNTELRNPRIKVVHRVMTYDGRRDIVNPWQLMEEEGNIFAYSDMRPLKKASIERMIVKYNLDTPSNRSTYNSRGSQKSSPMLKSINSMNSLGPINILVKSNTHRKSTCSVLVNMKEDFQMILDVITDSLSMDSKPCLAIYPVGAQDRVKDVKIDSMSKLKQYQVKNGDTFIACGGEGPPPELSSRGNGKGRNVVANGYGKKSDGSYTDRSGRNYQRHNSNRKSMTTDEDQSPTRSPNRSPNRSPRRDDHRDNRDRHQGAYGNGYATPRRQEEQNGYDHHSDPEDDRYGQRNRNQDDDERQRMRSPPSRGTTPDDEEMDRRLRDMEDLTDLKEDLVEF